MTRLIFTPALILGTVATLGAFLNGTNAMPSLWLAGISFAVIYATKGVTK
jgi:hypothetical protein